MELGADREVQIGSGHTQLMAWSADGKHLFFTSSRTGTNGLWSIGQGKEELMKPDIGPIRQPG